MEKGTTVVAGRGKGDALDLTQSRTSKAFQERSHVCMGGNTHLMENDTTEVVGRGKEYGLDLTQCRTLKALQRRGHLRAGTLK